VYPEVDRLLESEVATSILMRDQSEIHELVDDLLDVNEHVIAHEVLTEDTLKHLRQTLYSLHSQIESLFEKEEDVLVPLLTYHLPPGHVADLFEQMMESQS
jgi:iron-sulfur cluster repair protein YtfE (RIC family)